MGPKFFKIVHSNLNTTQHLEIPAAFVKHITKEGSGTLKGPRGRHWRVKLCERNEGVYLEDGWQDFVRGYSLGDFELVVFTYAGNLCFEVEIFDKTACEKQEGFNIDSDQGTAVSEETKKQCELEMTLVEPFCKGRCRGTAPKKFGKTLGCQSPNCSGCNYFNSKHCTPPPGMGSVACKRIKTENLAISIHPSFLEGQSSQSGGLPVEEGMENPLKAATSFTSNCPHFMKCFRKSIKSAAYVDIPAAFAKAHFPRLKVKVVLTDQSGNAWIVNFIPGSRRNVFSGGISAFVRDNQLKPGDTCIFELCGERKMLVHFFRVC